MDGDPDMQKILRFNVPIDPSNEEDLRLYEAFEAIPNGLKQTVARMALIRVLPQDDEQLKELLSEALVEQIKCGRRRGRRKKTAHYPNPVKTADRGVEKPQEITAAAQSVVAVQGSDPASQEVRVQESVPQDVTTVSETDAVLPEQAVLKPVASKGDLLKYGGMLGGTSWNM